MIDLTQPQGTQWQSESTTDMSWLMWWQEQWLPAPLWPNWQPMDSTTQPEQGWVDNSVMYKKVIDALMAKVQSKYGELNSLKFAWDNQNVAKRNDILKVIFDAMRKAGIDPSDPASINTFMQMVQQESPDLYELFVEAINNLLGPEQNQQDVNSNMGTEINPQDNPTWSVWQVPAENTTPSVSPSQQFPSLWANQ